MNVGLVFAKGKNGHIGLLVLGLVCRPRTVHQKIMKTGFYHAHQ